MMTARQSFVYCVVHVSLLTIGQVSQMPALLIVNFLLFIVLLCMIPPELFIPTMLFYLPWSHVMKWNADSYSFYTIGFALFFVVLIVVHERKQKPKLFQLGHLAVICSLMGYTLLVRLWQEHAPTLDYWMFMWVCLSLPLYLQHYFPKISFERCVLFLASGVLTASFTAKWLMEIPHMQAYIEVTTSPLLQVTRWSGFYGDANFYAAHILVAICGLLILMLQKNGAVLFMLFVGVGLLIYIGLLSVSKMFIVLLALVIATWLVALFRQRHQALHKMLIYSLMGLSIFIITVTGVFAEQLAMYAARFRMVSDVSTLTTGRSEILNDYLQFFQDKPLMLWLGQGYTNHYVAPITSAAHNTGVQLLYQFGIVGVLCIGVWILRCLWKLENKSFSIGSIALAIACFGPWLALDVLFADELFLMTVLFLVGYRELARSEM